jgi:cysteine desulfurase
MLYLDHAATTVVRPEVREAMAPFADEAFGNPSGIHGVSRRAKNAMEEARERAAELLGATKPLEIVFTGGGTEADNLAVLGSAIADGGRRRVVTSAIEHEAVLESARFAERLGCELHVVGVDGYGRVAPREIAAATGDETIVSVMAANNETGAVQPLAEIANAARGAGQDVLVHTDAVQAFISVDVTAATTSADMISLAAHKLGGPKGAGLLYVRDGIALEPVIHGGGQELGRRSGTHNVAGIVGLVTAMEVSTLDREDFRRRVGGARDKFEEVLMAALGGIELTVNEPRLVQHSHLRFPGVPSETLLIRLDQAGVAAAAGSACHSGAIEMSHVLAAMGASDEVAAESVRFSFGWVNDVIDGEDAAKRVAAVVAELR